MTATAKTIFAAAFIASIATVGGVSTAHAQSNDAISQNALNASIERAMAQTATQTQIQLTNASLFAAERGIANRLAAKNTPLGGDLYAADDRPEQTASTGNAVFASID